MLNIGPWELLWVLFILFLLAVPVILMVVVFVKLSHTNKRIEGIETKLDELLQRLPE